MFKLDGLNKIIHIDEITAKVDLSLVVSIDRHCSLVRLLLSRQESLEALNLFN